MNYLKNSDLEIAQQWMREAGKIAEKALCLKAKCGTVIVKNGVIVGAGYNAPPQDDVSQRRCNDTYNLPQKFKYDRTCCLHAEWRAIMDTLKNNPGAIQGSTLYFTRVNDEGELKRSGQPYCTECSRAALDAGIAHFVLWHEDGMASYPTKEYNDLSYAYTEAD